MQLFIAMLMTAALVIAPAGFAHAQTAADPGMPGGMGGGKGKRQQQQNSANSEPKAPKADENAYRAALKGIPDKPHDPWQNAR